MWKPRREERRGARPGRSCSRRPSVPAGAPCGRGLTAPSASHAWSLSSSLAPAGKWSPQAASPGEGRPLLLASGSAAAHRASCAPSPQNHRWERRALAATSGEAATGRQVSAVSSQGSGHDRRGGGGCISKREGGPKWAGTQGMARLSPRRLTAEQQALRLTHPLDRRARPPPGQQEQSSGRSQRCRPPPAATVPDNGTDPHVTAPRALGRAPRHRRPRLTLHSAGSRRRPDRGSGQRQHLAT